MSIKINQEVSKNIPPDRSSIWNGRLTNLPLRTAVKISAIALLLAGFATAGLLYSFYASDPSCFRYSFAALGLSGLIQFAAQSCCVFTKSQLGSKHWVAWSILFGLPAILLMLFVGQGINEGLAVKTHNDMPTKLFWSGFLCFGAAATSVGCYLTYLRSVGQNACDPMIQADCRWVYILFVTTLILIFASVYGNEVFLPKMLLRQNIPLVPTLIYSLVGISGALFCLTSTMGMILLMRLNAEAKTMISNEREPQWYDQLLFFFRR